MDIEWDEWGALDTISYRNLARFSQILLEIHAIPVQGLDKLGFSSYFEGLHANIQRKLNNRIFAGYLETIERLKEYFYIYHIHANNSLPKVDVGGYNFPPLIELSLVRKDLVIDPVDDFSEYPVEGLDFPNKTDRPDIQGVYPLGS
jgi:hypothetical protein